MKTSIVAAVAALSIFGIASSASAMCGPQVNLNLNKNINDVAGANDGTSVQEFGLSFNDNTSLNKTRGLTAGITISFALDKGRGCKEQDLRIAQQEDAIKRSAHQAEMQRQQQASALINNLIAGIQYCETANLNIPANANFCTEYLTK